jgi:hypothetical protein
VGGELGDRGVIVDDGGGDGAGEVGLEFAGEGDRGEGVEAEGLERGVGVEGGGRDVEGGGDARGEPGLEGGLRWRDGGRGRGGDGGGGIRGRDVRGT